LKIVVFIFDCNEGRLIVFGQVTRRKNTGEMRINTLD